MAIFARNKSKGYCKLRSSASTSLIPLKMCKRFYTGNWQECDKRLEELHAQDVELLARITELEGVATQHALSGIWFALMWQLLTVFRNGTDEMPAEQKRAAICTVLCKVIWDG